MGSCRFTRPWAAVGSTWRSRSSACSSAGRSTDNIRIAQTRSGAGLSRRRAPGMSSRRRLCGTANAGSGGADPVASRSIGSAALGHARTDRFVETVQPEHQNARSHGRRPTRTGQRIRVELAEPPPLRVSLVYPPNRHLALKLRAFLDIAAPRLKAWLAAEVDE